MFSTLCDYEQAPPSSHSLARWCVAAFDAIESYSDTSTPDWDQIRLSQFCHARRETLGGETSWRTFLGRSFPDAVVFMLGEFASLSFGTSVRTHACVVHEPNYDSASSDVHRLLEIEFDAPGSESLFVDGLYRNVLMLYSGWSEKFDSPFARLLFEYLPPVIAGTRAQLSEFYGLVGRERARDELHAHDALPLARFLASGRWEARRVVEAGGRPRWVERFRAHAEKRVGEMRAAAVPLHSTPEARLDRKPLSNPSDASSSS
jgi:hypothetical protein